MGKMYTCQNASCKKTFSAPLKTLNLQQHPSEPYPSCPYCLTKLEIIEASPRLIEEKAEAPAKKELKINFKEKPNADESTVCTRHVGYLSERSSKEQIPDDCLVCKNIVDCMLKKMRE